MGGAPHVGRDAAGAATCGISPEPDGGGASADVGGGSVGSGSLGFCSSVMARTGKHGEGGAATRRQFAPPQASGLRAISSEEMERAAPEGPPA